MALELGLAVAADFSGRLSSLVDSLLAETYSNFASMRLMEKAASLDLEQFESSDQTRRGLPRQRGAASPHLANIRPEPPKAMAPSIMEAPHPI